MKNIGEKIKNRTFGMCFTKMFLSISLAFVLLVCFIYITTIPLSKLPEWMPPYLPFVILIAVIYFGVYKPLSIWDKYILTIGYAELIISANNSEKALQEIKEILIKQNGKCEENKKES